MNETVRVSGPGEIAASIPETLGFIPADGDYVVLFLTDPGDGRGPGMLCAARLDPPTGEVGQSMFMDLLTDRTLRNSPVDYLIMIGWEADPEQAKRVEQILLTRWPVKQSLVTGGGYAHCLCEEDCPPAKIPSTSPVAAVQVTLGMDARIAQDRDAAIAKVLASDGAGLDCEPEKALLAQDLASIAGRDELMVLLVQMSPGDLDDVLSDLLRWLAHRSMDDEVKVVAALATCCAMGAFMRGSSMEAFALLTIPPEGYTMAGTLTTVFEQFGRDEVRDHFAQWDDSSKTV
jgi:hypothetical protein